jgi:hypothetical protein
MERMRNLIRQGRSVQIAAVICCLSFLICYGVTGLKVVRGSVDVNRSAGFDYTYMWVAGRCWLHHENPYDGAVYEAAWHREAPDYIVSKMNHLDLSAGLGYPPMCLPVFGLLALLPWRAGLILVWALSMIAVALILYFSLAAMAPHWRLESRLWLCTLLVQCRVIAFGTFNGQCSLIVLALILWAAWLMTCKRPLAAGAIMGLSTLKLTFTLPLIVYYALQRQWRAFAATAGVCLLLILAASLPIGGPVHTIQTYRAALKLWSGPASCNDTSPLNSGFRYDIVNIDVPLFNLMGDHYGAIKLVHMLLFLGAIALVVAIGRVPVRDQDRNHAGWLEWCAWTLLFFVFVYHRLYDVMMLWPVVVILLEHWRRYGSRETQSTVWRLLPLAGLAACFGVLFLLSTKPLMKLGTLMKPGVPASVFAPFHFWMFVGILAVVLLLRVRIARAPQS